MNILTDLYADDDLDLALCLYLRAKCRRLERVDADAIVPLGGSRPGKRANVNRKRGFYNRLLAQDYWGPSPLYDSTMFRNSFKMPIDLFDKILNDITQHNEYFRQKKDAAGVLGATPLQKVAAAVRILTSGVAAQELDDKYRLAASTILESLKQFCSSMTVIYEETALRYPNQQDLNRLLDEGLQAGFPGCIGSIDCMHWQWKNCPSSWKGMFQGKEGVPTVVLEAIADHRGRFWHFNFGSPGALNDINVLDRSSLFFNAVNGISPTVRWSLNGREYSFPYWLADGIYPEYACFVKTVPNPASRMQKYFASCQEAKRKDIERAFGVLQARFHILTTGCRLWHREAMTTVIKACVILHNLIIDHQRECGLDDSYIKDAVYIPQHPFQLMQRNQNQRPSDRCALTLAMKNREDHRDIQQQLMRFMWERYSEENEQL